MNLKVRVEPLATTLAQPGAARATAHSTVPSKSPIWRTSRRRAPVELKLRRTPLLAESPRRPVSAIRTPSEPASGDFEGTVTWGLGLSHGACFHAYTLSGPNRLVIDIQD